MRRKGKLVCLAIITAILCISLQGLSIISEAASITVYSQTDSKWASVAYGYSNTAGTQKTTVGKAGCGILSYVNAVYYMTGKFIEPATLAKWSVDNGCRKNGVGTRYSLYPKFASSKGSSYGFKYSGEASSVSKTKDHLQSGGTAIISVPNHLMALVDYDSKSNKYLVLDSYASSNRGTSSGYRWMTSGEFTGAMAVKWIGLLSPTEINSGSPVEITSAKANSTSSVTINWKKDPNAKSYKIDRRIKGENTSYSTIKTGLSASTLTFTDTGLATGTCYYYRVYAVYANGTSDKPGGYPCWTKPDIPEVKKVVATGKTKIDLAWKSVKGAEYYEIYRRTADGSYETVAAIEDETTYTDTDITEGVQYCYRVYACNSDGDCEKPNGVWACVVPEVTKATADSQNSLTVSWSSSKGAVKYNLYRRMSGEESYVLLKSGLTSTTYTDTSLKSGTNYWYKASAVDSSGNETAQGQNYNGVTKPDPMTIEIVSPTSLKLTWKNIAGQPNANFKIYRKVDGDANYTEVKTVQATSYTDTGLKPNTTYRYYFSVRDENNTRQFCSSSSVRQTTRIEMPLLTEAKNSTGGVDLKWGAISGAAGYRVYRKNSSGAWDILAANVTATSYKDKNVTSGTNYTYTVRAYKGAYATADAKRYEAAYWSSYDTTGKTVLYKEDKPADPPTDKPSNPPLAENTGKISAGNVSCKAGEQVAVPITVDVNPGIIGLSYKLGYDASKVKLVNVVSGDILDGSALKTEYGDNPYILSFSDDLSTVNINKTGLLATAYFELLPGFTEGTAQITLTCDGVIDKDLASVKFTEANGSISIKRGLPGDVNNDGSVKLNDAILLRRYAAGWNVDINLDVADVNGDGVVKLNDAILLRRYVAGWNVELK